MVFVVLLTIWHTFPCPLKRADFQWCIKKLQGIEVESTFRVNEYGELFLPGSSSLFYTLDRCMETRITHSVPRSRTSVLRSKVLHAVNEMVEAVVSRTTSVAVQAEALYHQMVLR
ncbi:MAG: hypothetical protein RBS07_06075 [Lentimicrobium sp.]|jgi:hypothetical protein|nr:hypothetical protein [Lentimicrobium sp.]